MSQIQVGSKVKLREYVTISDGSTEIGAVECTPLFTITGIITKIISDEPDSYREFEIDWSFPPEGLCDIEKYRRFHSEQDLIKV